MKPLAQHLKESFNDSSKKVSNEKTVKEDMSNLMKTEPSKKGGVTRGTLREDGDN